MNERMSHRFSVFNGHVNDAFERARAEFVAQFGIEQWVGEIQPKHDAGIMSIFGETPTPLVMAYVTLVTMFVNEDRV